ncbi:YncE family protein [Dictyobacter aurantiacus]|uniref:YncE family protein n=1 Tax=Dictyobacter aurantiacus TaxID=1936993 RepID=UPI000F83EA20|nr:YncE family protein [Dictyobacter aurantiacus]
MRTPVVHADGGAPNLAYVAGSTGGVGVIDVGQQKVTKTIKVAGDPHLVALSQDGRFLYVTQPQLNKIAIIAARTGDQVCAASVPGAPTLLVFDPNVKSLYVGGSNGPTVTVIDAENCTIKRKIETTGPVYGLAYAAVGSAVSGKNGEQLWVSNEKALNVYDDVSGQQLANIPLPQGPRYLSIPPGSTVYATTAAGSLQAIDLSSHKVSPLLSGGTYGPMDFDETTGEVYVPDSTHNQLVVLNPVNAGFTIPKEPNHVLKLDAAPRSIAITNDGQLGFAALSNGNVAMYDIPGRQLAATIPAGGTPQFIITGLYPPNLGTTPQQASLVDKLGNILGYVIVVLLLVVPFLLFRRYAKARGATAANQPVEVQAGQGQEETPLTPPDEY